MRYCKRVLLYSAVLLVCAWLLVFLQQTLQISEGSPATDYHMVTGPLQKINIAAKEVSTKSKATYISQSGPLPKITSPPKAPVYDVHKQEDVNNVQEDVQKPKNVHQSQDIHINSQKDVQSPNNMQNSQDVQIPESVHKVLFLTYSRSGSSFLGEVINRNKQGFYHFEPLFGIYSALYGIKYGMRSMAVFEYGPGEDRWPPLHEAEVIAEQISDLLSCNLDRLPVEVLQDRFSMIMNKEEKFEGYRNCLKKIPGENASLPMDTQLTNQTHVSRRLLEDKKKTLRVKPKPKPKPRPPLYKFTPAYDCKSPVEKRCGTFFDKKREYSCFQNTFGYPFPNPDQSIKNQLAKSHDLASHHSRLTSKPIANTTDKDFIKHNQCLLTALEKSNQCIQKLEDPCKSSSIRGAKVIRMRMENVAHILAKDPDIKVVHYFRDPRGLELSRSVGMKGDIQREMIKDAKLTCRKMQQDINARKQIERDYPQSFMVLKYEDLAIDTEQTARRVYDFIGAQMPEEVNTWLRSSTNSSSKAIHSSLGTSRKNSTQTALKWREKMPRKTQTTIAEICADVLRELGYEV